MDIHTNAAEFVMSLLIASTILTGLIGIFFAQIRISSDTSVNRKTVKPMRRVLYISITLGVIVLISCSVWFMTSVSDNVIFFTIGAFLSQIYFFIRPAISYGSLT